MVFFLRIPKKCDFSLLGFLGCAHHPAGSVPRAASCGQHPAGSILRAASCGQHPAGSILRAASCGQHPAGSILRAASCGQHPAGSTLAHPGPPWPTLAQQQRTGLVSRVIPWVFRGRGPALSRRLSGSRAACRALDRQVVHAHGAGVGQGGLLAARASCPRHHRGCASSRSVL